MEHVCGPFHRRTQVARLLVTRLIPQWPESDVTLPPCWPTCDKALQEKNVTTRIIIKGYLQSSEYLPLIYTSSKVKDGKLICYAIKSSVGIIHYWIPSRKDLMHPNKDFTWINNWYKDSYQNTIPKSKTSGKPLSAHSLRRPMLWVCDSECLGHKGVTGLGELSLQSHGNKNSSLDFGWKNTPK